MLPAIPLMPIKSEIIYQNCVDSDHREGRFQKRNVQKIVDMITRLRTEPCTMRSGGQKVLTSLFMGKGYDPRDHSECTFPLKISWDYTFRSMIRRSNKFQIGVFQIPRSE